MSRTTDPAGAAPSAGDRDDRRSGAEPKIDNDRVFDKNIDLATGLANRKLCHTSRAKPDDGILTLDLDRNGKIGDIGDAGKGECGDACRAVAVRTGPPRGLDQSQPGEAA